MLKAIFLLLAIFSNARIEGATVQALQPIMTAQINITDTPMPQIKPLPLIRLTVRREPDGAIF